MDNSTIKNPDIKVLTSGFTIQIHPFEDSENEKKEIVKEVLEKAIKKLLEEAIENLDNEVIRELLGETIENLDNEVIKGLLGEAIENLDDEAIKEFLGEEIKNLDDETVKAFLGKTIENLDNGNGYAVVNSSLEEAIKEIEKSNSRYYWSADHNPDLISIRCQPEWYPGTAWNFTYKLRQIDKVIYAEPKFDLLGPKDGACPQLDANIDSASKDICTKIYRQRDRYLEQMQIKDAWGLFKHKEQKPGQGITIAHPDTGYLPHPEVDSRLVFYPKPYLGPGEKLITEEDVEAHLQKSSTDSDFPVALWHGTATASLIVSSEDGKVTGVAPYASLEAYRLGPNRSFRFNFFSTLLANAIEDIAKQASNKDIRVISISLGGYPDFALRRAIINAQRKGIIIVACAGNNIPFSVWPSTYANVVSVASSNFDGDRIAAFSSVGRRIDVAAPSEHVFVATVKSAKGKLKYVTRPRAGTSYAVPLVAGIAALWLSYHGWDNLVQKYGISRIPIVFDKLLRETCTTPPNWDTIFWGSGIVNAYELLKATLPGKNDPYIQESLAYREADHIRLDSGGVKTFIHLFEQTLLDPAFLEGISTQILSDLGFSSAINRLTFNNQSNNPRRSKLARDIKLNIAWWTLSEILDSSGKDLRQYLRTFGQEITFYLATNPVLYEQMKNLLKRQAGLSVKHQESWLAKVMYSEEALTQSALIKFIEALKDIASDYLKQNLEEYLESLKSNLALSIGEFSAKRLMDR